MNNSLPSIEALIFSSPKGISAEEIGKILRIPKEIVILNIKKLMNKYKDENSGIEIVDEGGLFKFRVKPGYANLVSGKSELGKGLMMTLSAIALNSPINLSDLVKQRGSIARKHVIELMKKGFIYKKKEGNKVRIYLSNYFYEYFGINKGDLDAIKKQFMQS